MSEKNMKNQNLDDDAMFVTLDLDDGSSLECEILTIFDVDQKDYIALMPLDEKGNDNVTYIKGDIIIKPRKVAKVGKHADIQPGKWTILATNDKATTFNVRIGNYVQEYKHGQEIVLSEGDEVCPTSTTIILR